MFKISAALFLAPLIVTAFALTSSAAPLASPSPRPSRTKTQPVRRAPAPRVNKYAPKRGVKPVAKYAKKRVYKRAKKRISTPISMPGTPIPAAPPKVAAVHLTPQQEMDAAKETSIDRIVVSLFRARVKDKRLSTWWYKVRGQYQKAFVSLLNERSYLNAFPVNQDIPLNEGPGYIAREARSEGVDGVLVGEYLGTSLDVAIRSGVTGRTLVHLTIPMGEISKQNVKEFTTTAVDAIVESFPYRGFVIATQGQEAKLNLGRFEGVKVGTKLEVFQFDGANPNFTSPIKKIGDMEIVRISNNAAIAKVTSSTAPITPYMKVAFAKFNENVESQSNYRTHSRFWLSIGPEFLYMDTEVSDLNNQNLTERIYQVPLSPAVGVGLGAGRFNLYATYSGLSNQSNNVTLVQATGTFQIHTWVKNKTSWLTSLGGYFSEFATTQLPGGPFPLVSTTTFSAVGEERYQYVTSPQTKLFAAGRVYFPVVSNDALNGRSNIVESFGGGLEGGLRLDLSTKFAIEGALQVHDLYINMPVGSLNEFEYGFYAHLLVLF